MAINKKTFTETVTAFMAGIVHSRAAFYIFLTLFVAFFVICVVFGIYGVIAALTSASIWYMIIKFGACLGAFLASCWLGMNAVVVHNETKKKK